MIIKQSYEIAHALEEADARSDDKIEHMINVKWVKLESLKKHLEDNRRDTDCCSRCDEVNKFIDNLLYELGDKST